MTGTKGAVLRAQACLLPEEPCRWVTAPSKAWGDFSSPGRYEQGFGWLSCQPPALGVGCGVLAADATPFPLMKDSGVDRRPCYPAALHRPRLAPGATRLASERFPRGTAQRCGTAAAGARHEQGGELSQLRSLFCFPEAESRDGVSETEALSP